MLDEKTANALRYIAAICGNLPDDRIINRSGPGDAEHRGQMLVNAREIARECLIQNGHEPPPILGKDTPVGQTLTAKQIYDVLMTEKFDQSNFSISLDLSDICAIFMARSQP